MTLRSTPEPPPARLTVERRPAEGEGPAAKQIRLFGEAIRSSKAKTFFANLAEALCSDDSFAETTDTAECWNGHRVGEYTKALVKPGLDAQKYNPELSWTETTPDPRLRALSDKLRHMRQVVMSHVHLNRPVLLSFSHTMGSGSGSDNPSDDEDIDDPSKDEGSGSGDGIEPRVSKVDVSPELDNNLNDGKSNNYGQSHRGKTTGSAFSIRASLPVFILIICTRWIL